jgi:Leucine-rich repeat (LRR) protein
MAAIIFKACAYDRGQRYQSASEMRRNLENLINPRVARNESELQGKPAVQPIVPKPVESLPKNSRNDATEAIGRVNPAPRINRDKFVVAPPKKVMIAGKYYSTSIEKLELEDVKLSKSDLLQLSQFTNLADLNLTSCGIGDMKPLSGLKNLEWLILDKNRITDVSPLSGLKNLKWLFLSKNQITDVSPLSGLKHLDLNFNQITDVSPLSVLQNLERLLLLANPITDFKPLYSLKKLTFLSLDKTQVNSAQIQALRGALPKCKIDWL